MEQFLECLDDEDDCDECGKIFFCESVNKKFKPSNCGKFNTSLSRFTFASPKILNDGIVPDNPHLNFGKLTAIEGLKIPLKLKYERSTFVRNEA